MIVVLVVVVLALLVASLVGIVAVEARRSGGAPTAAPTGDRILPASNGFYSKNNAQTSSNYNPGSSMFHAADKVGGRQKAVALYIAVDNQWQMLSESTMFLNHTLSHVGLNPNRFWRAHSSLVH